MVECVIFDHQAKSLIQIRGCLHNTGKPGARMLAHNDDRERAGSNLPEALEAGNGRGERRNMVIPIQTDGASAKSK
jgi:hypothetical protein